HPYESADDDGHDVDERSQPGESVAHARHLTGGPNGGSRDVASWAKPGQPDAHLSTSTTPTGPAEDPGCQFVGAPSTRARSPSRVESSVTRHRSPDGEQRPAR